MPDEPARPGPRSVPTLAEIARVFTRYANTTFGGGSATIAVLLLILKRVNTVWIIGAAAALSFAGSVTGGARLRPPGATVGQRYSGSSEPRTVGISSETVGWACTARSRTV